MTSTDEQDLRLLLRSPALALEPEPGLADVVRGRARRVARRRRITSGVVAVAVIGGGVALTPVVARQVDELRNRPAQNAGLPFDRNFPNATSEVVTMRTLNGAQVVTWYEKSQWCTAASRVTRSRTCLGPVDAKATGIPRYLGPSSPSLKVDNWQLAAGVVGANVARVRVHLVDGREIEAELHSGKGFVLPVWSALIAAPAGTVDYVMAFDKEGRETTRLTV